MSARSERAFRRMCGLLCLWVMFSLCGCADAEQMTELLQTIVYDAEEAAQKTAEKLQSTESQTEEAPPEETQEENAQTKEPEEEAQEAGIPSVLYEGCCFAYQSLREAEQLWYQEIAGCLGSMEGEIRLDSAGIEAGLDETDIDRIFQCVLMDHPELFYVEGYTYTKYTRGEELVAIRFSGTYGMGQEQVLLRQAEIDGAVQALLEGAAAPTDDYDKVKYVYDTIICNTEYDLTAPDNQNIYSVFVNGKSVCQGYAKAVQYLLERMGVECTLVQGSVDTGEGHAWNLVKVNGSFYYVDATWGDASYQADEGEAGTGYVPEINYDYLCVTTQQLLRTHILSNSVPMPACVEEKDNYYVREGALFAGYDREQMRALFQRFFDEGRPDVTVKCADEECFRQLMAALVDGQEIFDYLGDGRSTIAYTQNEKQLSMTFWVTNE